MRQKPMPPEAAGDMVRLIRIPSAILAGGQPGVTGSRRWHCRALRASGVASFFAFREELQRWNCGPQQVLKLLQMTYTLLVWCFL